MIGLFMRSQWHNPPKAQMTVELLLRLRSFLTVNCGQCKRCTHKLLATLQQLQLSTQKKKQKWIRKTSWVASFGFCCMATPRLGDQESSTQSRRRSSIECFNGAENVVASLHRCKLVPSCSSWSMSYVRSFARCWFAANVNVQTQLKLICPSIGIAGSPLVSSSCKEHVNLCTHFCW